MRPLPVFIFLLLSSTAYAADQGKSNVFKADLSNQDLKLAVTSFENICLPFILHKTELTRELDKAHNKQILESQNFSLQSSEKLEKKYIVEPSREEWKPASQPINGGHSVNGDYFTIFNGVNTETVKKTELTRLQTGEIDMRAIIPDVYVTKTTEIEAYNLNDEDRLTARIGWNYPSQNHPGKSCEIQLDVAAIEKTDFTEGFIKKDEDWQPKENGWSQCIKNDDGEFLFTAKYRPEGISIAVKRDDFYETHLCK